MDLRNLKAATDAVPYQILDPVTMQPYADETGLKIATLYLVGMDSKEYKDKQKEQTNKTLRMAQVGRGNIKITAEEGEANKVELLAACIKGWENISLDDAEDLPYTKANALRVLREIDCVREQVEVFVYDRANFMKTSSISSAPTLEMSSV